MVAVVVVSGQDWRRVTGGGDGGSGGGGGDCSGGGGDGVRSRLKACCW